MSCSLSGTCGCKLHSVSPPPLAQRIAAKTDFNAVRPRDFDSRPMLVIWEMTQACDLSCAHCRANSRPHRHSLELSTAEAFHLIDQIADMHVPLFVLSGGDPLKRPDLMPIVQYACRRGVRTSLTPSTTPLLVRNAIFDLKASGLMRLALSLDGSTRNCMTAIEAWPALTNEPWMRLSGVTRPGFRCRSIRRCRRGISLTSIT